MKGGTRFANPPNAWLARALRPWTQHTDCRAINVYADDGGAPAGPGRLGREDRAWVLALISGTVVFRAAGRLDLLRAGDVAIIAAGTPFRLSIRETADGLMVVPDAVSLSMQWLSWSGEQSTVRYAADGVPAHGDLLVELLATLVDPGLDEQTRRAGWTFLVSLLPYASLVERTRSGGIPLACKGRELIEREFAEPSLDVAGMADRLGVHRSTLLRAFRRQGLPPPQAFLTRCRLDHAQRLLRATTLHVADVARRCGFASRTAFVRAYRRDTGVTPESYRRFGHHDGRRTAGMPDDRPH